MSEISAVVNDCPLTCVLEGDQDTPLTPNDLLRACYMLPDSIQPIPNPTKTAAHIIHIWRQSQTAVDAFWHAWSTLYLNNLRSEKHPYIFPHATTKEKPQVNHVVLVAEKHIKSRAWKIGRILSLNTSDDGEIWSATSRMGLRTPNLTLVKKREITHPICHLYPLELAEIEMDQDVKLPAPQPEAEAAIVPSDVVYLINFVTSLYLLNSQLF